MRYRPHDYQQYATVNAPILQFDGYEFDDTDERNVLEVILTRGDETSSAQLHVYYKPEDLREAYIDYTWEAQEGLSHFEDWYDRGDYIWDEADGPYRIGSTVTLQQAPTPPLAGMEFVGWKLTNEDSSTIYPAGSTFIISDENWPFVIQHTFEQPTQAD